MRPVGGGVSSDCAGITGAARTGLRGSARQNPARTMTGASRRTGADCTHLRAREAGGVSSPFPRRFRGLGVESSGCGRWRWRHVHPGTTAPRTCARWGHEWGQLDCEKFTKAYRHRPFSLTFDPYTAHQNPLDIRELRARRARKLPSVRHSVQPQCNDVSPLTKDVSYRAQVRVKGRSSESATFPNRKEAVRLAIVSDGPERSCGQVR